MRPYLVVALLTFSLYSFGSIYDYLYPNSKPSYSNYGSIGLIQNPTARYNKEGTLAFSWSHNEPYLRGSIIAYPFNWMEASFQYTDINNALYSPFKTFSGSQSLKDKSFDIKINILREDRYRPQLSLGMRDIGGTGLFSSEYFVMNKYISENIDLSFGVGWGNLSGNNFGNPLSRFASRFESRDPDFGLGGKLSTDSFFAGDAGLFGGVEYFVPNMRGLRLKLEYDGTNYKTEGVEPLSQNSKINYGIIFPLGKDFLLKFSSVRGNTFNFGFSYSLSLGERNPRQIKKIPRVDIKNKEFIPLVTKISDQNLYKASLRYLSLDQIYLQKADRDGDTLKIEFAQSKFRNPVIASGRVLQTLNEISPPSIENFQISQINGGIGVNQVSISRADLQRSIYANSASVLENTLIVKPFDVVTRSDYAFAPPVDYPKAFNSIGPDLRSQIGGPDGFFFGDLKLTFNSEILFNRNLSLVSVGSVGLINNLDELKIPSNSILPHVRTDIVDYMKESRDFSIRRMQLNYFNQYGNSFYYKFSAGILESMFNGFGFEALYKPFANNFAVGVDGWQVKQREFKQLFGTRDYETLTGHVSFYYMEPRSNILFKLKGGRYLAKDSGFTFDASRIFRSGLRVGAFFSLTDISSEEFGEGSFDKGFYFWVPVDIFSPRHFKRTFGWGLRPITRDGAQSLVVGYPLWGVTDQSHYRYFRDSLSSFYD